MKGKTLTTNQLAHRWRGLLAKGTIENWRQQGRGPKHSKLGAGRTCQVLYWMSDIEKFEKSYFIGGIKKWQR